MGICYLRNYDEIGIWSLYSEVESCMYLPFDHDTFTNKNLDDKCTAWSSRIFFTIFLGGTIDFEGSYGNTAYTLSSIVYKIVFDRHFLCVLSGKIVNKNRWEDEIENLGLYCIYINLDLE